ncbi:hypothetical protein ACFQ08_18880 [Streptosporangium algeriense]|uniref:Uncharacterized protein n=1 Tax=Streptosporangium algeriense TaxID=1682748 RepID=A0ABW3DRY3_9ACTN
MNRADAPAVITESGTLTHGGLERRAVRAGRSFPPESRRRTRLSLD